MKTASPNRYSKLLRLAILLVALLLGACGTVASQQPAAGQLTPTTARQDQAPQQELPKADACLPGIIPGQSTREDVITMLGEPESVEASKFIGEEVLQYPAAFGTFPVSVIVRDGVVALIGKDVDTENMSLTSLLETYSEPESTTFSNFMMHTMTYLYPSAGVAFVVAPDSDLVFYQQCVQPTTLEEYMSTWGVDLPLENPFTYKTIAQ